MTKSIKNAAGILLLAAISIFIYSISHDLSSVAENSFRLSNQSFLIFRFTAALFCIFLITGERQSYTKFVPFVIVCAFLAMFLAKWTQHLSFNTHSQDVGLFHSALWNSLHGNWMFDSVRGQFYLADHLILFLYFLVPFYWIYQGPETLCFLSALAFAGAAFVIYKLSYERLRSELAGFLILAAFITNRYVWGAFLHEFHPDFFAPIFLFLLFLSFHKKQTLLYFLSLFSLLFLKEDYALYLIPAGIYFLIQKHSKSIGLLTIILSGVYFLVAYQWLLPHMQKIAGMPSGYSYVNNWSHLGSGPAEIMKNVALNPALFLSSISFKTVATFFTKFMFLPILSPASLLFVLPPLFLYASAQFELIRGLSIHYGLIPSAFGFVAAIEGLKNIARLKLPQNLTTTLASAFLIIGLFRFTFYIPMPESNELKMRENQFSEMRPMCVQSSVFPHLVPNGKFSIFPECLKRDQYLLLFLKGDDYPLPNGGIKAWYSDSHWKSEWQLVENSNGLLLFKREPPVN